VIKFTHCLEAQYSGIFIVDESLNGS